MSTPSSRAFTIHDSLHRSRIGLKSRFRGVSWIGDSFSRWTYSLFDLYFHQKLTISTKMWWWNAVGIIQINRVSTIRENCWIVTALPSSFRDTHYKAALCNWKNTFQWPSASTLQPLSISAEWTNMSWSRHHIFGMKKMRYVIHEGLRGNNSYIYLLTSIQSSAVRVTVGYSDSFGNPRFISGRRLQWHPRGSAKVSL